MPIVKLTARNVLTLRATGGRVQYTDEGLPGFVLRVSGTGARTYGVMYRHGQQVKRVRIGDARRLDLADARRRAREILGRVAKGDDPAGERAKARRVHRAGADTFEALASRLVESAELARSTRRSWLWVLQKYVFPKIGTRDPAAIGRGDLRELLAGVKGVVANDTLKVIRWVFARSVDADLVPHSPAAGLRKPAKERPRDRVLTPAELRAVWNAAGAAGLYGAAVRFAMLTAARREEVFSARHDEMDLDAEVWRISSSRTKTRKLHEVALTKAALDVLGSIPATESEWIFAGRDNGGPLRPSSKAWASLLVGAGLVDENQENTPKRKDLATTTGNEEVVTPLGPPRTRAARWSIRFHDLRRTVRDALTRDLGVAVPIAEAVLGHAAPKIIQTYAPTGIPLKDTRRALEKWAAELERIIGGRPAEKVTRMPANR